MEFKIDKTPDNSLLKIQLHCFPENEVITAFFSEIRIANYPKLIKLSAARTGYCDDITGVTFPADLDPTDTPLKTGMIRIDHQLIGEIDIDEQWYFSMLKSFANELLIAYDEENPSESWKTEMKAGLTMLSKL